MGTDGWKLGRIGGIEIKIDPSWSIIAFLIAYTFYVIVSAELPGRSTAATVAVAVVMTIVFFASVLLHELAHSWMARSRGVEVRGITLFVFGGATEASLDTEEPSDELAIAAVGPLTSLAIAAVLWVVAVTAGEGPTGFAAGRLGWINLALAVFNLVPGFPLDGGRILRSLIWRSKGDVVAATRTAARVGRGIGYGLIALGALQLVTVGALIGGLWLMAIGWFLSQTAQASFLQLRVRRMLADVPAGRLTTGELVDMPAGITVQEAVDDYFMRHDFGAFPLQRAGQVVGLVTLGAVRRVPRDEWDRRPVDDIAIPLGEECTVGRSEPMHRVLDRLSENGAGRVIVMDGEIPIGMITNRDLAQWLRRADELGLADDMVDAGRAGGRD